MRRCPSHHRREHLDLIVSREELKLRAVRRKQEVMVHDDSGIPHI
jgi:hypothetical protein